MESITPPCKLARFADPVGIGTTAWGNFREMKTNGSIGGDSSASVGLNLELGCGSVQCTKLCGFTPFQLQELQLQALIFKYMEAGLPVPYHLLLPVWKSVVNSVDVLPPGHTSFLGSSPMSWSRRISVDCDPEPGRCRRTDGKKWRCGNEAVPQKKYCERHMQRGRLRSRKLVETPQHAATTIGVAPSSNTDLSISLSVNSSSSSSNISPGLAFSPKSVTSWK